MNLQITINITTSGKIMYVSKLDTQSGKTDFSDLYTSRGVSQKEVQQVTRLAELEEAILKIVDGFRNQS